MNKELQIVFQVNGLDAEGGHVRLEHLIDQLELFKRSLQGIDSSVDEKGRPAAYYRVVAATHSSPLTITLEPVPIRRKSGVESYERVKLGHDRYFQEVANIRDGKPPSPEVDDEPLEALKELLDQRGKTYKSAAIHNNSIIVPFDEQLNKNVDFYLKESDKSFGTLRGKLDAVNLHGNTKAFYIYPITGPKKVRCDFMLADKEKVKQNLEKIVEVSGIKHFRPKSMFPHRMAVREIESVESPAESPLKWSRGASKTGGDTMLEINTCRDEW